MTYEYQLMDPPFQVHKFEKMDDKQAIQYFEWFVSQENERISILKEAYHSEIGKKNDFDGKPESLVNIWRHFSKYAVVQEHSEEELKKLEFELPAWAQKAGIQNAELSVGSLAITIDIGFYIKRVFDFEYANHIKWELWKKTKGYYFNRPVLVGFGKTPLVPHDLVVNIMWEVIDGNYFDEQLLHLYQTWKKILHKHISKK